MSPPLHFIVPGPIDQRTGGYIYDRRIVLGLRASGRSVEVHELAGAYPKIDAVARRAAAGALDAMPPTGMAVIDGLALPAFADLEGRLPRPWVAVAAGSRWVTSRAGGPEMRRGRLGRTSR